MNDGRLSCSLQCEGEIEIDSSNTVTKKSSAVDDIFLRRVCVFQEVFRLVHRVRSVSMMKHAQRRDCSRSGLSVHVAGLHVFHTQQEETLRGLPLLEEAAAHLGREVVGALEGNDAKVIPVCYVRPEACAITPWPSEKTDLST